MTTATLSAEDVRRLVMEPFCRECNATAADACYTHDGLQVSAALFTRCPDCQPEGLKFHGQLVIPKFYLEGGGYLTLPTAPALILQSIARSGQEVYKQRREQFKHKCDRAGEELLDDLYTDLSWAVMQGDLPGAVAARQRLKDLEQADE